MIGTNQTITREWRKNFLNWQFLLLMILHAPSVQLHNSFTPVLEEIFISIEATIGETVYRLLFTTLQVILVLHQSSSHLNNHILSCTAPEYIRELILSTPDCIQSRYFFLSYQKRLIIHTLTRDIKGGRGGEAARLSHTKRRCMLTPPQTPSSEIAFTVCVDFVKLSIVTAVERRGFFYPGHPAMFDCCSVGSLRSHRHPDQPTS